MCIQKTAGDDSGVDLDLAESRCLKASTTSWSILVWQSVLVRVSPLALKVWECWLMEWANEILFFHMESISFLVVVATMLGELSKP